MSSGTIDQRVASLCERLRTTVPGLARVFAADDHADISAMPVEIRDVELPQVARGYYLLTLEAIGAGRPLADDELDEARVRGEQRAREGFPLDLLLHNWTRGAAVLWQACVSAAGPDDKEALVEIATRLFPLHEQQLCAVATSYHDTRTAIDRHERGTAALVTRMLAAGEDATALARRADVRLARRWDVVVVALPVEPAERQAPRAAQEVADRRRVQQLAVDLDRRGPEGALATLRHDGGLVLLPRPDDAEEIDAGSCRRVLEVLGRSVEATATGAAWFAPSIAEVPGAVERATEVLRVAQRAGRGPGLHGVESEPIGYLLSRPGAARDQLVRVLAPLDPHPELLDTVRALLDRDGDRGRTARALGVHPNTVNNRLVRIKDLLGLDPVSTHGIVTLSAALTARRLGPDPGDGEG